MLLECWDQCFWYFPVYFCGKNMLPSYVYLWSHPAGELHEHGAYKRQKHRAHRQSNVDVNVIRQVVFGWSCRHIPARTNSFRVSEIRWPANTQHNHWLTRIKDSSWLNLLNVTHLTTSGQQTCLKDLEMKISESKTPNLETERKILTNLLNNNQK